jgi:hypothetical protein
MFKNQGTYGGLGLTIELVYVEVEEQRIPKQHEKAEQRPPPASQQPSLASLARPRRWWSGRRHSSDGDSSNGDSSDFDSC